MKGLFNEEPFSNELSLGPFDPTWGELNTHPSTGHCTGFYKLKAPVCKATMHFCSRLIRSSRTSD